MRVNKRTKRSNPQATFRPVFAFYGKPIDLKEEELVKQCREGSRKAQRTLFERYASLLRQVAKRYVRHDADAEDVLIMAFTRAFANLPQFGYRGEGSLEAWLRRIIINEALMWLRRRHNFALVEEVDEGTAMDLSAISQLPAEEIMQFVTELPDGYRTVFNLYVVEGFSHPEIAALLGISEPTSRSQLHKAKASLKQRLTREGYHYGT